MISQTCLTVSTVGYFLKSLFSDFLVESLAVQILLSGEKENKIALMFHIQFSRCCKYIVCQLFLCPKVDVLLAAPTPRSRSSRRHISRLAKEENLCFTAVSLNQRKNAMLFQQFIDEEPTFLSPAEVKFRIGITVLIRYREGLALDISHVSIFLI